MKRNFDIRPWLKPVLTVLLGILLIFRPDSITSSLALCVGIVLALAGAAKMVGFFSRAGQYRDLTKLLAAIVLLIVGFAIIRNPVSLEKKVVRVIGILLLLEGIRGYRDIRIFGARISSTALCVAGAVLILMPVTAARLAVVLCGIAVLLIGVCMAVGLLRSGSGDTGDVIDQR